MRGNQNLLGPEAAQKTQILRPAAINGALVSDQLASGRRCPHTFPTARACRLTPSSSTSLHLALTGSQRLAGVHLIKELCVTQTNQLSQRVYLVAQSAACPQIKDGGNRRRSARQLHSNPVHTLPVCRGLPRGYYFPNNAMITHLLLLHHHLLLFSSTVTAATSLGAPCSRPQRRSPERRVEHCRLLAIVLLMRINSGRQQSVYPFNRRQVISAVISC